MPGSAVEGKDMVKQFVVQHDLRTALDIGPGEGTYWYALQGTSMQQMDGIEAWGPYLNTYDLWSKYKHLWIADAYYFNWDKLQPYDLVLLGDVLEHMSEEHGKEVIAKAAEKGAYVVLSLPIYVYHQGWGDGGNWFESHLVQYSHDSVMELLKDYEVLETFQGEIIGCYIFKARGK